MTSWTAATMRDNDYYTLPRDYTPQDGPFCDADSADGYGCTRRPGHTGRHAAGDSEHIVAVWTDAENEPCEACGAEPLESCRPGCLGHALEHGLIEPCS